MYEEGATHRLRGVDVGLVGDADIVPGVVAARPNVIL